MPTNLQDIYLIRRVSGAYQEVPATQFNFLIGDALGTTVLGQSNTGYSEGVSVLGGCGNRASGFFSVIGGGERNCVSTFSHGIVGGGFGNTVCAGGMILGGCGNSLGRDADGGVIVGGTTNFVSGQGLIGGHAPVSAGGTVIGGCVNSALNGGLIMNSVLATARGGSTILGSYASVASGASNVILGGSSMAIYGSSSCVTILNGEQHQAKKTFWGLIAGGLSQCLNNANRSTILLGASNSIVSGAYSAIINGCGNSLIGVGDWCNGGEYNDAGYSTRPTLSGWWRNIDYPETGTTYRYLDSQIAEGHYSQINNGFGNTVCAGMSTVINGYNNFLSGSFYSTILNGVSNTVQGFYSTILNGRENFVQQNANYSLAGGRKSRVLQNHSGAMVLSDSTDRFKDSVGSNTLTLDFTNGIWFKSNINPESISDSLIRASGRFI